MHVRPRLGRFLEVNPIEGGSANDYDYVNGDPVNGFDLDGLLGDSCSTSKNYSKCIADRKKHAEESKGALGRAVNTAIQTYPPLVSTVRVVRTIAKVYTATAPKAADLAEMRNACGVGAAGGAMLTVELSPVGQAVGAAAGCVGLAGVAPGGESPLGGACRGTKSVCVTTPRTDALVDTSLHIARAGVGRRDRAALYAVVVDGTKVATIEHGGQITIPVEPGRHTLPLKVDWTGSPTLSFEVGHGQSVAFACRPKDQLPLVNLLRSIWRRDAWIELTADDRSPGPERITSDDDS